MYGSISGLDRSYSRHAAGWLTPLRMNLMMTRGVVCNRNRHQT